VTLEEGGRAVLDLPLQPTEVGDAHLPVTLTTPDGRALTREVRLSVLHTDPETARTDARSCWRRARASASTTRPLAGFREGTARATLIAGAGAALDLPGLVQRLVATPTAAPSRSPRACSRCCWRPTGGGRARPA
jgi:alpha-2-macroglobulin